MRGRLINPFGVQIYRLSPAEIAESPGYDSTFREPKLEVTADGLGRVGRKELDPVIVPGQFSVNTDFMKLLMSNAGNLAESMVRILFHFRDLENMGLVEASTGLAQIKPRDRLGGIYTLGDDPSLIQAIKNPPGLYVTEAAPHFGLGRSRNLLVVTFMSRDPGMPVATTFGANRPSVW
jgi:hypothetical protein